MKKILYFCLIIVIAATLMACDSQPKTITFLTNRTDLKNTILKDAQEQFAKYYADKGWNVRVETVTDYENIVSTRISGNNYGDVLLIPQTVEPKDLDKYFHDFGTVEEMKAAGWTGVNTKAFNGNVYGLPVGLQSSGIMINLDVFNKAEVEPATLTTPALFLNAMLKIQSYGKKNIADWKAAFHTQTATGWGLAQWAGGITTAAGDPDYLNYILPWDNDAFWNETNNTAGNIGKMYELLYDLIVNDVVESSPTIDEWEESKIWFAQGKIAAMSVGSWAIDQFEKVAESIEVGRSDDVGYMPYPFEADDNKLYVSIASDYTIGIAKNTKAKEVAVAFAKWFVDEFNYANKTGNIPPKVGAKYPAKIEAFNDSGAILVEETPATITLEGALSLAEKNAASSITDEKRIALWDSVWILDYVATAFDVRDNKKSTTSKELLQAIQNKWNNGISAVIEQYGNKPNR
ncbi:MAG: carbohydrate ABC transporter substrate-binding protein [Acholeplasmataceae bacterium]|jgi:ABC-type glycerol-3-phosphate transport system substrate-binding protein|nr:carbohydrate ABC transporter substrate-binding protein [Acholeplasmataceae bacterium]